MEFAQIVGERGEYGFDKDGNIIFEIAPGMSSEIVLKAVRFLQQAVRNQIANEIEAMRLTFGHDTNVGSSENCSRLACIVCKQVKRAAAIARGEDATVSI